MLKISFYGCSDTGLKRTNNEDAFLAEADFGICVLADGMGGAAAGEIASQIFIQTAMDVFTSVVTHSDRDALDLIQESYERANQRILQHVEEYPQHKGMGCTGEMLVFNDGHYAMGHVGDSRIYLYRNGNLQQLTRDHSLVQDLIDQGAITPAQARTHLLRHVIMRAVGTKDSVSVQLETGDVVAGDVFLVCSDGLTDMIDDAAIDGILALPLNLADKVGRLIEAAKLEGGKDNITVVLGEL